MKKIVDYIKKGNGVGTLWIFIFSTIIAIHSAFFVNKYLPQAIPAIQQFADEILPIKIENGKLVVPENTIKIYTREYAGQPFSIVLDTTKDMIDQADYKSGIYVTRSYIYSINDREVRRQNLIQNVDLPKKDYTQGMHNFVRWLVCGIVLIAPFFNFICFFISVCFYAFCSSFACILNRAQLNFKTKMRLNTVLFIGVYLLSMLIGSLGIKLSLMSFFLLMIALQIVTIKKVEA